MLILKTIALNNFYEKYNKGKKWLFSKSFSWKQCSTLNAEQCFMMLLTLMNKFKVSTSSVLLASPCLIPRWMQFLYKIEANLENPVQDTFYRPSRQTLQLVWLLFSILVPECRVTYLHEVQSSEFLMHFTALLFQSCVSQCMITRKKKKVFVRTVIWRKQQQLQYRLPCQVVHARFWINYAIIG